VAAPLPDVDDLHVQTAERDPVNATGEALASMAAVR
jgi:hypothetical protein